ILHGVADRGARGRNGSRVGFQVQEQVGVPMLARGDHVVHLPRACAITGSRSGNRPRPRTRARVPTRTVSGQARGYTWGEPPTWNPGDTVTDPDAPDKIAGGP